MHKPSSISCNYNTMCKMIQNGEHWVRNDWKDGNKYVILSDDRYVNTRCLLLVSKLTDNYTIYHPSANDFRHNWKRIDG